MNSSECKGCSENIPEGNCDYFSYINKVSDECPCGVCLLKGICIKVCENFINFRLSVKI